MATTSASTIAAVDEDDSDIARIHRKLSFKEIEEKRKRDFDKVTSFFHTFQPTLTPTGFTSTLITSPTSSRPIYLDMQATTPMDPRVLAKMVPYFLDQFGNPHSRTHVYGWETEKAVEEARGVS